MNQNSKKESNFKRLINKVIPPPEWRFPVIILLGVLAGISIHIFYVSNAASYLSDDPAACVNCHVMTPQYATWEKSSHRERATCNDCHVPHDNEFNKYFFKAKDGARHTYMFTFRLEPQVIRIKEAGKKAVQENCIRCHKNNVHPVALRSISASSIIDEGDRFCWDCHRTVPHGRVNSLSSTPNAKVPGPKPIMPEWMEEYFEQKN